MRAISIFISATLLLLSIAPVEALAIDDLYTCTALATGKDLIARSGKCIAGKAGLSRWSEVISDSAGVATDTGKTKQIILCASGAKSRFTYSILSNWCTKDQVRHDYQRIVSPPLTQAITKIAFPSPFAARIWIDHSRNLSLTTSIVGYEVKVDGSAPIWIKNVGQPFLEVGGLSPLTFYTFEIAAINADGHSPYTEPSEKLQTPAIVVAKASSSSSSSAASLAVPSFTLSSSSEVVNVNQSATGFTINSTGGAIDSFTISSTPAGMTFNTTTGSLTGTPTVVRSATTYTITAYNAAGSATRTFNLTVNLTGPTFTLSSSAETRTVNTAATGFTIHSTGGAIDSFTISSIPPGMSFDTTTGTLSGTPTSVAGATTYTVTARNNSGSSSQTFTLTVLVAAPAFTLSSSAETRTVNTTATGFTINSTGGAIASFSISSTPPGMTFNTSTGALTGTPNTVAGATVYTITGTNASGSTSRTFTLTVTAVAYTVGQTGPGGGVIFYVASSTFSCGPTLNLTCKYLEYSPKGWSGSNTDPGGAFSGALITQVPQGTSSAIGAGYQNTLNIIAQGSSSTTAPGRAQSYRGGGLSDWYLPSELEWSALYNYINLDSAPGNEYTTDFNTRYFWSSTETTSSTSSGRVIDLYSGAISDSGKNNIGYAIRPIRAFG